ncbi:CbiX/SirB N-terminal domain-containing protein [Magnetovibrio sp.]|uniref:CbiX/SirB N-terminal domain-containing protein n=1 Tax=Magnetovibrio sp. TaxID=2024836 RepID=UPI002F952255
MAKDDAPAVLDFSRAGLLIAAHGSPSTPGGRTSSRKHAETIRKLALFADVRAGFLTEKPFVKDVLDDMNTPEIFVVPNLACAGFITTNKLPMALSLTGPVTERITPNGHQRIFQTAPVGTDPAIAKTFAIRIRAAMADLAIDQDGDTAVVVVGHGSQRSRASFEHTTRIAGDLGRHGVSAPIYTSFLEETPFIKDWRALSDAQTVVFAPFLISDGYHGADEIPREIGFDVKSDDFISRLSAIQPNELTVNGRRLVYLPPLGDAPEMAELILTRVRAAQSEAA